MSFYIINLLLTYILIGVVFSTLFFFLIKKDNTLLKYFFCLLFGIIGSFLGVFFGSIIHFDPLKYIYFFKEIFTTGIFWPSVFSFIVLFLYTKSFEDKR